MPKTYVLSRNRLCLGTAEDAKHRDGMGRDVTSRVCNNHRELRIDCPMDIASVGWNTWTASKIGSAHYSVPIDCEELSKLYTSILKWTFSINIAHRSRHNTKDVGVAIYHFNHTYIKRIEQVNSIVHVVSEINRKAIEVARERDEERSHGLAQGSLHGVPILAKNLLFTTDGLKSTFGCTGLLYAIPSIEATTIIKLREQGAIILGANNRCTPGWSAVGGQCLGVYHKDQHPKGSSSGSAVGTALGLCAAALGTETSGSVILPAQRSAVVGIKPTVGMTSRYGMYISSDCQDTVGILARSVKDAALVLTVIAGGEDEQDSITISDPRDSTFCQKLNKIPDFTKACNSRRLDGHVDPTTIHLFENALDTMRSLGATIVDPTSYSTFDTDRSSCTGDEYDIALKVDIYHNINKTLSYFSTNPHSLHTLSDVIAYTIATPAEEATKRGLGHFESALEVGKKYARASEEYRNSMAERNHMGRQIPKLLDKFNCDMIVLPTNVAVEPADVGGCPVVSVPMGFYPPETKIVRQNRMVEVGPGIPLGISFVGRRWEDEKLMGVAYAYEQATRWRDKGRMVVRCDVEICDYGSAGAQNDFEPLES
ncbi:putative glutamyl-trna amidotransferase subunit a protein [Botrytis fragariae]|uniref:Putative glutamyl-trna amidotransferase subunit a protein n=1 Tax=Botrytis fragariae TaxID=1964551 RepID=A0A8H6ELB8_9HELO|nr:putative glutamyl-trna amidotransferase subunit a protein [Botrytis fragariae]KAF5876438.1 putative glutamyl-trna amidotransferase subunit a protein [Botrytis fragariae]